MHSFADEKLKQGVEDARILRKLYRSVSPTIFDRNLLECQARKRSLSTNRIEDDEMSPLYTDGKAFDDKTLLKRLSQLFQGSQFHIGPT